MTIAMCLSCGAEKWGAFNPCKRCGAGIVESQELAIAFSDHHLAPQELHELGLGLEALRAQQASQNENVDEHRTLFVRLFAFLEWVTVHRSDILRAEAPEDLREAIDALARATTMPAPPPQRLSTSDPDVN